MLNIKRGRVGSDYTRAAYSDAIASNNLKYYDTNIVEYYNRFCHKLRIKPRIIIYKFLFSLILWVNGLHSDILFVYHGMGTRYLIKSGFVDFARKKNPKSYHVYIMWDVFDFEKLEDLNEIRAKVDEIVIPDSIVAKKYGITFYPLFYSKKKNIEIGNKLVCMDEQCGYVRKK